MTDTTLCGIRAARSGDREAAGKLIEENSGLIWSVARRYFGRGVDADDLYQLGCVGFLKAIEVAASLALPRDVTMKIEA